MLITHGNRQLYISEISNNIQIAIGSMITHNFPLNIDGLRDAVTVVYDAVQRREEALSRGEMLDSECMRVRNYINANLSGNQFIAAIKYARTELKIASLKTAKDWVESFYQTEKPFGGTILNWSKNSSNRVVGDADSDGHGICTSEVVDIVDRHGYHELETKNSRYILINPA